MELNSMHSYDQEFFYFAEPPYSLWTLSLCCLQQIVCQHYESSWGETVEKNSYKAKSIPLMESLST
jgi:hypothetical protein